MARKVAPPARRRASAAPDDSRVRGRLIEAVIRLVARQGLAGTSTREIARAADCNVSLISYYFDGKDGLYCAALAHFGAEARRFADTVFADLRKEPLSATSLRRLLGAFIDHKIDLQERYPDMQVVLFREFSGGMPYARELFKNTFLKIIDEFEGIVKQAQRKKILRARINGRAYIVHLFHLVDSYFMMKQCEGQLPAPVFVGPRPNHTFKEHLLDLFLEGGLRRP